MDIKKSYSATNEKKIDEIRNKELKACSALDCTGLVPSAIKDESQKLSYEELYPFMLQNEDE